MRPTADDRVGRALPCSMDAVPAIFHVEAADGTRLAYHVLGSGPPLVLLFPYHVNDLVRNWAVPLHRRGIQQLAEHFTVVNLDLRGAGQSQRGITGLDLDTLCQDVHDVLRDAGVDRTAVLAMGSSGLLAARLALRDPRAVTRMALLGAGESPLSRQLFGLRVASPSLGSDLRAAAVVGVQDGENTSSLASVIRNAVDPPVFAQYERLLAESSLPAVLARAAVPTLVVHAVDDQLIPLATAEELAATKADAHVLRVPVAAQMAVWRDEDAVSRMIAFLDGRWSGDAATTPPTARRHANGTPQGRLTPRERDALRLVAAGRTNGQIGGELFISINTVSHHLRSIFTKTVSGNRTEAAAFAHRHGLT